MFTGIVDDVGTIEAVRATSAGRELRVRSRYAELVDGESIALDGACLTVREHGAGWFTVAAVTTTLDRTTIGEWTSGRRVNLERALRAGDRLGGHLVQGHVDAVATVRAVSQEGDARLVELALPSEVAEPVVPHGSIAVDGVSLTVNRIIAPEALELSLIDYTLRHTTLGELAPGRRVHVEMDVVGKYVHQLLAPYLGAATLTADAATAALRR